MKALVFFLLVIPAAVPTAAGADLMEEVVRLTKALGIASPFAGRPVRDRRGIIREAMASGVDIPLGFVPKKLRHSFAAKLRLHGRRLLGPPSVHGPLPVFSPRQSL